MSGKESYIKWLLCVLFLFGTVQTTAAGRVIYVDDDAVGTNDGSSWANAFNYLQDALTTVLSGYEIRVAEGVYTPDKGSGIALGDRTATFQLINGVALMGGYAGLSTLDSDVRDVEIYETILSGDCNGDDPNFQDAQELANAPGRADNSLHVVTIEQVDSCILDGFIIRDGHATDGSGGGGSGGNFPVTNGGGGLKIEYSSPVIQNCKFIHNWSWAGGAVFIPRGNPEIQSSPEIHNCKFMVNASKRYGGALSIEMGGLSLMNCEFVANWAEDGGAIYSVMADISLSDCMFQENRAVDDGGGLSHVNGNIYLTGCSFVDNSALPTEITTHSNNWGGAMYINISSGRQAIVTNCLFRNNKAVSGGAIQGNLTALKGCRFTSNVAYDLGGAIDGRGTLTCEKCLFDGNKALAQTAVAQCYGALLFTNCTFVDNRSPDGNAFLALGGHGATLDNVFTNCIVWGTDHGLNPARSWLQKTLVTYCDIQGGWPGKGNIDVDPYFVEPGYWDPNGTPDDPNDDFWVDGDYHLKSQAGRWDLFSESWVVDDVSSPCIDAGDPNSPVAFEPFPNGGIINMGAYGGTAEASISPTGTHAKYGGGTGEPNNPYLIYTAEQMNNIGLHQEDWSKQFKLMADIDLSGYTGTDFNVIGIGFMTAFSGVFDGNGHTISNFNYSSTGENLIGIFSYIDGPNAHISNLGLIDPNVDCETNFGVGSLAGLVGIGTITNCHVIGGNVTGKQQVGGLIGICDGIITDCYAVVDSVIAEVGAGVFVGDNGGSIIDCYSTGNITGLDYIGGLVGTNIGSIVDCYSDAGVEGRSNVGGLLGWNLGSLKNCSSTSSVTGTYSTGGLVGENRGSVINCYCSCTLYAQNQVGGIVGINDGIVTASYSSANIHGRNEIGGLVGYNTDDAEIVNCYANGDVIGQRYVGGLVGNNATANPHAGEILSGTIRNCYSVTLVSGDQNVGGLIGHFGEDGVSGSFWDIEASGLTTSDGGVGKTTLEMQDLNTFIDAGWDFVGSPGGPGDIWAEPEGGGYPVLMWQLSLQPELPAFSGGSGEPDDPYLISTDDELNSIGHNPRLMNAHFKLVNDIDLTGVDFFIIASQYHPFQGTFDGNDHTISNFSYTSPEAKSIELFGYVSNGRIKNLGLIDPNVHVDKGDFHGCLVGRLGTGTITHCYVESGSVTGQDELGGLVGENGSSGVIMNCYFTGEANGKENVGGLVGQNHGSITASYSYANVEGQTAVGGLVGRCSFGETVNCYARGNVVGQSYVGGLVGSNGSKSSYYSGTILNCYSASAILKGPQKGGLLGVDWGGEWAGAVNNCFWDIEISGLTMSYGGEGKTTVEMQTASTFLDAGWDFVDETTNGTEDIWWILEGQDYPRLWWEPAEDLLLDN